MKDAAAFQRGFESVLCVPLVHDARVLGEIIVNRRPAGGYSKREIELVQAFADQAVIAMENARLFNETKQALEQQTATAEVLKAISSTPAILTLDATILLDDITASLEINSIRWNRCRRRANGAAGKSVGWSANASNASR